MSQTWRDEQGDLWVSWCERFGNGFHSRDANISVEIRYMGIEEGLVQKWEEELIFMYKQLEYNSFNDTIGSD